QNTDRETSFGWGAEFNNLIQINGGITNQYIFLTDEFEPTGKDDAAPLPADQGYHFTSYRAEFRSDRRKVFAYGIEPSIGGFFNGNRYSVETFGNLRLQPKFNFRLNVRYDRIELPNPHSSADIWLVSPRFDVTFNKAVFWSTLIQYSNQRDNLGFNSRLQWRFAPLSDLFLVYNDNYFVNTFMPRNRSINLKLTYWLNI
ncbi:MAG: hydrolase, partial [Bacteroidota bacterium]